MKITGTFLNEITFDIPSNNWGPKEWAQDFGIMKSIGIDTVILIKAGLRKIASFPSKALVRHVGILPVYTDLVDMFLELAEQNDGIQKAINFTEKIIKAKFARQKGKF